MIISSPAFGQNQPIPVKYACDGDNVNPPLEFSEIPPGTQSLALIMDDPDAPGGTFVHWLIWNLPTDSAGIMEDLAVLGATQGRNDGGSIGYLGPCPPAEEEHRYFFRLYALDSLLDLPAGSTHEELNMAMGGHIIVQTEFNGVYQRQ